jgi:hypothetical protein
LHIVLFGLVYASAYGYINNGCQGYELTDEVDKQLMRNMKRHNCGQVRIVNTSVNEDDTTGAVMEDTVDTVTSP